MFKLVKMETAVGTETQLNKLQEEGWRVAGCGPDYIVLTDSRQVKARRRYEEESETEMRYRRMLRESNDLHVENEALRKRLSGLESGVETDSWEAMRASRDRFQTVASDLFESLLWASGASDFSPGDEATKTPPGQASVGWDNGPRVALEAYQEALRLERAETKKG